MATLRRDGDGEGFSGAVCDLIDKESRTQFNGDPSTLIGKCVLVGSVTAGMFSTRDWWRTSPVTEILSATKDSIKFKTLNSVYTLRR